MVKEKQYTVISTFAGGGGSSLGYQWAGFKELLAIDFDKNACETLTANFPDLTVWNRDIKTVQPIEILKQCNLKKGELDILDGSPPCQGFSTAGKRNLNDSRNDLFLDFVRLIKGLQPKIFIMENVSGMMKGRYKSKFNEILKTLKDTGYNVKVKLMNAMWYEVPQSRERLFFIGIRNDLDIEPSFPKPLDKVITVKEAISKDGYIRYRHNYSKGSCSFKESSFDKPLLTLTKRGTGWTVSPEQFTEQELKILCSFPADYKLLGGYSTKWARLGNAVMPKMMYHIAKNIKENILEKLQ